MNNNIESTFKPYSKKAFKGTSKPIVPGGFENAIVVVVEKHKTTIEDVCVKINKAIDEKKSIIIENIDKLF